MSTDDRTLSRLHARSLCAALALATVATAPAQDAGQATVFEAARIVLAPGAVLEGPDAKLMCRDGKVVAAGREVTAAVAQRARRETFEGATLVPGFVLPHHHLSLGDDLAETIDAFTPHLSVADAFDPFDERLAELAETGVTAVVLAPLSRNTFAGRAALVKPGIARPGTPRGTLAATDAYLKIALVAESLDQNRFPTSRMGAAELIRTAFADARDPLGPQTPQHATLRAVLDGSLPLAVHARTHAELTTALDVFGGLGLEPVLLEATELGDSLARLGGTGISAALPPLDFDSAPEALELPARLEQAGVPFSFLCDDGRSLRRTMALAVRHGLSRDAALAAATRTPAVQIGAADRIGSLRVGHDADFCVFHGDPTDLAARLVDVRVGGRRAAAPDRRQEATR
ncbi:MAG: amidohydrolase family protein [Planctomycetes bacterium]|nr:amidohydrolase family protein [Planctomycetota bacterium]